MSPVFNLCSLSNVTLVPSKVPLMLKSILSNETGSEGIEEDAISKLPSSFEYTFWTFAWKSSICVNLGDMPFKIFLLSVYIPFTLIVEIVLIFTDFSLIMDKTVAVTEVPLLSIISTKSSLTK